MEFKDILNLFLQTTGITQTKFAKTIDVKQSQVSEWLHGKAKPGYEILRRIVLNFDKPAEYWLGLDS